ncbi:MAG: hypothetical protein DRN96_04090 [Thermoproteota archaeon]|nr:MAG: hypothetical protein DRN96_04090 [Candidatus Korarchaeota archaeon]
MRCGKLYPPIVTLEKCACGGPLSLEGARSSGTGDGVWRYRRHLPSMEVELSLGEAATPLIPCIGLQKQIRLASLYVKDESKNPTGSYIDRGSAVLASAIASSGLLSVRLHGDGNYIASMGAYLARAGVKALGSYELPVDLSKTIQASLYGVKHSSSESSPVVSYRNPFMLEGLKTIAIEMVEQLNTVPSAVIVPTATGVLLFSLYKGFRELLDYGSIDNLPVLYAAVSKGHPLVSSKQAHTALFLPVADKTYIEEARKALRGTGGDAVEVSDAEMIRCVRVLARVEGILAEPSAAASVAACFRISKRLASSSPVVALVTGSGLKALDLLAYSSDATGAGAAFHRIKVEILKAIAERAPIHAYGIYKLLNERGLATSPQLVYAYLEDLSKRGLVYSMNVASQRRKKVFYLTPVGRSLLSLVTY